MCVLVYVTVCVLGNPPLLFAQIKVLWHMHSFNHGTKQQLAHLGEFSPCLLFGVLLQYLTHSLVAITSSHIQGC